MNFVDNFQGVDDVIKVTNPNGDPITAEWDVCKSATGELQFYYTEKIYADFSYDPLDYIEEHLKACWEGGNLEIFVDRKETLKSCFTKEGIQMLYILDETEIPLKLGSNNITQENIKDKKNLNLKIENEDKIKKFRRQNIKSCSGELSDLSEKTQEADTSVAIFVVFGSIGLLVVVVIGFTVIRKRRMKNDPDYNSDDGEDIEDDEAAVTN